MPKPSRELIKRIEKALVDKGLIVEAGWASLKLIAVPEDASERQLADMRMCFFAGAQHLFSSILSVLEEGEVPTATDLSRMDKIQKELDGFLKEFKRRHGLPE